MSSAPQPRNHVIDLKAAAEMTARHRGVSTIGGTRTPGEGDFGGMFSKDAILKLLSSEKAYFLRFYYGRNSRGGRELILTATDADGNDLLDGDGGPLDWHFPCPPYCSPNSILRG